MESVEIVEGLAVEPFTVAEMNNPEWWKCPRCKHGDVNSVYRDTKLFGFRCVSHRVGDICGFIWHYKKRLQKENE